MFAQTPKPPYYAVIFTSKRIIGNANDGYKETAQEMMDLVRMERGFLGAESLRDSEGRGVTISYWRDLESIRQWKNDPRHFEAQKQWRQWYEDYRIRICKVERESTP